MEYKPGMDLFKDPAFDKYVTTFSNSPCWPNYCLRQSYPETYPFENNPMTGSIKNNLPKTCNNSFFGGETSLYKIEKGFKSSGNESKIKKSQILDLACYSKNKKFDKLLRIIN